MGNGEDIVRYLFSRSVCIHPYRISRVLLLAEWRYMEKYGRRMTSLTYKALPYAMYVEELPDIMDKDPCLEKRRMKKPDGSEYGCVSYTCPQPPSLDEKLKTVVDSVLGETNELSDQELNKLVIKNPNYRILLEKGKLL